MIQHHWLVRPLLPAVFVKRRSATMSRENVAKAQSGATRDFWRFPTILAPCARFRCMPYMGRGPFSTPTGSEIIGNRLRRHTCRYSLARVVRVGGSYRVYRLVFIRPGSAFCRFLCALSAGVPFGSSVFQLIFLIDGAPVAMTPLLPTSISRTFDLVASPSKNSVNSFQFLFCHTFR